ncbi:DHH family phosphoesterase [Halorientalis brevis]|uniref:DHH family phosphoesterase n=1 Tax=Halorientalis brevis TaxID=1126241 RepID=A0ABD6CBF9_9EURY|nr:OB-fold nucleic acid binding domain-containing protein [Halorientalis brevis]
MSPTPTPDDGADLSADGEPVVYDLADGCTLDDVSEGNRYHATVNGVVAYGVFVDLSASVSGLVHESNLVADYDVGDELIVELAEIREDGDISFEEVELASYETERVDAGAQVPVTDLEAAVGDTVTLDGIVVQIKQTGGPTIFHVRGESGVVPCAAFEEAGVRAYPDVELDDVVRLTGRVERREESVQIEVDEIERFEPMDAKPIRERLDDALDEQAEPAEVEPLVDWPAFEKLRPDLERVAKRLRAAALDGRPIRMRHHADGDGLCASVPLQLALERFLAEHHHDPDAPRHLLKRLPSKAPFYEMEDVTRDLNFALENRKRHGQKLPMLCMLDNGSTEEDTPAYRNLAHYDVPIIVVDHHHPDPDAVGPLVTDHVNPYLHDEDYRITTGMLSVELARMIDPSLTDELRHVPAVAGLSDRSQAEAMDEFIDLAAQEGYDEADLRDIGEALDYATHWLKYNDGRQLINDVLNVNCDDRDRHEELVEFLAARAERDVEKQLDAAMSHVEHEELDNGAHLYRIDVENFAHRFTYPAPGKTTGEIHDRKVQETGDPVITIGYGPDFAVLRSDGVRLDIPEMVVELTEEIDGGGVSGGGHLVVGSIKFVSGMREEVLDALVEKMADAELDEALAATFQADE